MLAERAAGGVPARRRSVTPAASGSASRRAIRPLRERERKETNDSNNKNEEVHEQFFATSNIFSESTNLYLHNLKIVAVRVLPLLWVSSEHCVLQATAKKEGAGPARPSELQERRPRGGAPRARGAAAPPRARRAPPRAWRQIFAHFNMEGRRTSNVST